MLAITALHGDDAQFVGQFPIHAEPTVYLRDVILQNPPVVKFAGFVLGQAIAQEPIYAPMAGASGDMPAPPDPKVPK